MSEQPGSSLQGTAPAPAARGSDVTPGLRAGSLWPSVAVDAPTHQRGSLPPGPRMPPPLQAIMRTWRYAEFSERGHARFGDTFTVRIGGLPPLVLTKDRDTIRRLFTGDPLAKRHANDLLRPFVGDQSLLVLEPAEHLARRKMLLPPFHGERVQSYARLMERLVSVELDRLKPGDVVAMQSIAQTLTLDVILQAVLGISDVATRRRLRRIFDAVMSPLNSLIMFVPRLARRSRWNVLSRRAWSLKDELDALLFAHIAATRTDERLAEREDILAMMVLARDEEGSGLTDQQLRDELITLIAAGHETTATAIAWGVELLVHNPAVMSKAREGDDAYIDALVKEVLRIRLAESDCRRALRARAIPDRQVDDPAGRGDKHRRLRRALRPRHLSRASRLSTRALSGGPARRLLIPSVSGVAPIAASALRLRCWRSGSCCARSSRALSSRRCRLRSRARCPAVRRSPPAEAHACGSSVSAPARAARSLPPLNLAPHQTASQTASGPGQSRDTRRNVAHVARYDRGAFKPQAAGSIPAGAHFRSARATSTERARRAQAGARHQPAPRCRRSRRSASARPREAGRVPCP